MIVHFDVPREVEELPSRSGRDPSQAMKEAALVDLYRRGGLTEHQLGRALGLPRLEAHGVLKRHKVDLGITAEEIMAEADALRAGRGR